AMPKVANRMCENLRIGFMQLGMFQNVREMKMLDIPKNVMRLDDTGVDTWIQKNQFRADFIPLQKFVISEMERLLAEVPKC
ncbi:MAG: hypothetical protein QGF20_15635, partial [Alphaproteobacteria bacterium]|nr:hypothetical protein [Alphaproteobacteria bacterium]